MKPTYEELLEQLDNAKREHSAQKSFAMSTVT